MEAMLLQRQQQLGADQTVTNCLLNISLQPSMINWCARTISVILFVWLNDSTTFAPKRYPAPRGESTHPEMSVSLTEYRRGPTTSGRTSNRRGGSPASGRLNGSAQALSYLVDGVVDAGTEPAVDAEDAVIDDSGEREVVKDVCAVSPNVERAVLAQALIVEPVDLRDLAALVVAPDESDQVRVAHLVGEQEEEGLHAVEAAVDKIPEEEVADPGDVPAVLEELEQVVELAVDIATDGDWRVHALDVALLDQDLPRLRAEVLHLQLADDLPAPQLLDLLVQLTHIKLLQKYSRAINTPVRALQARGGEPGKAERGADKAQADILKGGQEVDLTIYKNQIMTEPEIAGYITYWYESALSQTKKVPFYIGENTVGRDPSNKVTIPDSTVSKVHAKLIVTPTDMHYIDVSKNGTKVMTSLQQSKLEQNRPIRIYAGMTLYLGDVVCRIERVQMRFPEETMTMIRPANQKQKENIVSMLYGSDSEDEIKLDPKNHQKVKEEVKEKPANNSRTDVDQFSLTGDFYQADKKAQNKSKKQKETKKVGKNAKEEKKQPIEDKEKIDQNVKNKKKQKRVSLQKLNQSQQKQQAVKSKDKKIEHKFIIKSPKQEQKGESVERKTRGSRQRQQMKKKQTQKQQKIKKEKQQLRRKQIEKQQKHKKEKEEQKKKQKQQRKKKQRQQLQKKEKQQQQKKIKQLKEKEKDKSLEKPISKQKKRRQKQKETDAQQEINISRRNQKKQTANEGQSTKRRISRKRLPSTLSEQEFYPLRRSFINKRVLVSGFAPILTKKYFYIVENIQDEFDFLVMKQYKRTFKALYSICKGIHILRFEWIIQSQFLEKTLKPEGYIFKEMDFIYQSIEKVNQGFRVFKGYQFYLGSDEYHLKAEDIEALIYAGGGELMKKIGKLTSKEKEGKNKIAIIRIIQQKTHKIYEEELKRIKKLGFDQIYTIQMVLDSCERQQINWQKNKISLN